jgi:hypothetical protein
VHYSRSGYWPAHLSLQSLGLSLCILIRWFRVQVLGSRVYLCLSLQGLGLSLHPHPLLLPLFSCFFVRLALFEDSGCKILRSFHATHHMFVPFSVSDHTYSMSQKWMHVFTTRNKNGCILVPLMVVVERTCFISLSSFASASQYLSLRESNASFSCTCRV